MKMSGTSIWRGGSLLAAGVLLLPGSGCIRVKTDPVEVKPIHITVDVNVRVDRELSDFFDDIDKVKATPAGEATK
jgi:hypothetical protein